MTKIGDYNEIMNDHNLFNKVVYTPLSEALRLLDERRKDPVLMAKVEKLLKGDIPEILRNKKCAILCRQVATPNYESRRFIALAKENNLYPVFFEYHNDKFTSNNKFKHSLGQLHVKDHTQKKIPSVEKITIVDFSKHDGKKLKDVKTIWDELLVDFHKKLFSVHGYSNKDFDFYNVSDWLENNGGTAINYYTNLLLVFTCFGILFENFLISKDTEEDFTKNIVLPSLEKVIDITSMKPLISPLEPLELETENLWYHHTLEVKRIIPKI
jgi:hypothetical protein